MQYDDIVYPGKITNVLENQVQVLVMHPVTHKGTNVYKWPVPKDRHIYPICDILKFISPPIPISSLLRAVYFRFEDL